MTEALNETSKRLCSLLHMYAKFGFVIVSMTASMIRMQSKRLTNLPQKVGRMWNVDDIGSIRRL